jgi:hypothetical protein
VAFPYRGKTSSRKFNDVFDQLVTDVHALSLEAAGNESRLIELAKILVDENRFLKRRIAQLELVKDAENRVRARNNLRLTHHQSMYEVRNLDFFATANLVPLLNPTYGLATLPVNAVENKFVRNSVYSGDVIVPLSLTTTVSSSFANEGTATVSEHEPDSHKVDPGTPENAFNGVNQSYWVRTVEYPADSDVAEVEVELIVTVPSQNNTQSNVLTIHPYPVGGVDITDVSVSADLTSSFTKLNHSEVPTLISPTNNAREQYYLFPAQDVDQVKIRLRQRHFIEEDGKKVFRYGLQEVGLMLVDFEKTNATTAFDAWSQQTNAETVAMAHRLDAPAGSFFTAVHNFSSTPDFTLEDAANRHVIYRIYNDNPVNGSGTEIWNSNQTLPQDQPSSVGSQLAIAGNVTSLYIVTSLRFVETAGGANSPYKANTAPYVKGFTLEYSVSPSF